GSDEAAVRMLPLLLGLLTVALTFRLGQFLGGRRTAWLAALLVAFNPLHIAYSQEARQYAALVALTTAGHLLLLRCLCNGTKTIRARYFFVTVTALFTHYFAVPALAPHALIAGVLLLTADGPLRRNAIQVLLVLLLAALPFAAWLPVLPHQAAQPWHHLRAG